jgi:hypothetical protein
MVACASSARTLLSVAGFRTADDVMHRSIKAALTSKVYDVDDFTAAQELYHSNGWTDGLPVVPPTESTVEACLEWARNVFPRATH